MTRTDIIRRLLALQINQQATFGESCVVGRLNKADGRPFWIAGDVDGKKRKDLSVFTATTLVQEYTK